MATKKFYWLKFSTDFFYGENSKLYIDNLRSTLKSQGDTLIVIFLKMMLQSLSTEGLLEYKGIFPTLEEELAHVLFEDMKNVQMTISYFLNTPFLEAAYENDKIKSLFIPYAVENTGSKSDSAVRMEKMRKKQQLSSRNTELLTASHCDTDIASHCDTDIRDKDIRNLEFKENLIDGPQKKAYGFYGNVFLTNEEYAYIKENCKFFNALIDDVSRWLYGKKVNTSSHFKTVMTFIQNNENFIARESERSLSTVSTKNIIERAKAITSGGECADEK